jgi:NAD(P)-dependent dehydrogenase (short-subunit alcohol dehydrogenase family)
VPLDPSRARLDGRRAVVTGAAAGIGRATVLALARFGADVAACDRDAAGLASLAKEVEALGRRAPREELDVRDGDAVRSFVARAAAELGGLDVLVNNAGGTFHALFADLSENGEDALVRENFSSVASFVRAALPHFGPRGGAIVNVTSIEAWRAAPGYAVYAAAKAAVESLTRSLALELAPRRIRVNCVAPDAIPTPGTGGRAPATPLPGPGTPDDVAAAVVFLASDLSAFVTGTTLHVDGGNLAAGGWRRRPDGSFEP